MVTSASGEPRVFHSRSVGGAEDGVSVGGVSVGGISEGVGVATGTMALVGTGGAVAVGAIATLESGVAVGATGLGVDEEQAQETIATAATQARMRRRRCNEREWGVAIMLRTDIFLDCRRSH